ncbi:LysR family transcriptional regulator [Rahnella victoriana]|nr:LysR family transcriptional regulator [Rahnella victoriana]
MLGFTAVSGYWQIPQIIALAAKTLPEITLVMKEMVSSAQLQALAARTLDIGFVRQPVALFPLAYHRVLREPLCVALPAASALAAKPRLRLRDFAGQPFIMYSATEGKYFYDCIAGLFAQANVVPHYVQHCSQTHTILGLVRAGVGLAIVPDSARQLGFPDIEFRPLSHPDAFAEIYMAWRQDGETPALAAFREMVREHCSATGASERKKLTGRRTLPKLR